MRLHYVVDYYGRFQCKGYLQSEIRLLVSLGLLDCSHVLMVFPSNEFHLNMQSPHEVCGLMCHPLCIIIEWPHAGQTLS